MPDRTAKFVFAIFASVLAGASLAGLSLNAVRAADDCLTAPKAETPEGSHWYYRIEHGTKRHCWYLRAEGETLSQTAAPNSPPNSSGAAKPPARVAAAPMQRSVADARAELPPRASIEAPTPNGGAGPAVPTNPAVAENNNVTAPDSNAPQSVVASRWLDPSAMSSTLHPPPAQSQTAANVPPEPQSDSPQSDSAQSDPSQSDAAAALPAAAAVVPLATADSSGLPASLPMLLAVMTGALALAGLTASLVLKFGGARRTAHSRVRRDRIWEPVDDDRIGLSPSPDADVIPRRPHFPRDLDQPAEPGDRVAEFYAQLSKQVRG